MAKGIPLTDADRWDWLNRLRKQASLLIEEGASAVFLACSALKESYRDVFRDIELAGVGAVDVYFIFLRVDPHDLIERVEARKDHYMKAPMVKSQLDCLEQPQNRERDIQTVQVAGGISNVCISAAEILRGIMASAK
jgi:gluconokinase